MSKFVSGISAKAVVFLFGTIVVLALAACGGGGGVTPNLDGSGNANGNDTPTTGTIAGTVLDAGLGMRVVAQAEDGTPEPVEGADVSLTESETGDLVDKTTTDENGEFEFEDVPADETYDVTVEVELEQDLDGDGRNDVAETSTEVTVEAGQENRCDTEMSTEDADGDGQDDSVVVETNIEDSTGKHQNRERQRHRDGETDVDNNGDGEFDESISDNDLDGDDDSIDDDDDNDGIEDSSDDDSDDNSVDDVIEFEARGSIEAVGESTITINGVTYTFDELTRLLDDNGVLITLEELLVGSIVEIEGYELEDGALYLYKIKLEDETVDDNNDANGLEFEVKGFIEAIGEGTITIVGVTYTFDDITELLNDSGEPITLEELLVGLFVEIEGFETEGGVLYASKIKVESEDDSIGYDDSGIDDGGQDDGTGDDDGQDDSGDDDSGIDNGGQDDSGDDNGGIDDDGQDDSGDDNEDEEEDDL